MKDEQGLLIAGVSVVIDGTTTGTTTGTDGDYAIIAEPNDVLVYSFIGYSPVKERVGSRTVIDIVLIEDIQSLNEVVVNAGYWEVKEKEQTGNVSRMVASEIASQNISNPLQAMQGRMAGVNIQQTSGMPGGGIKIQVRGQNSLRDGSDGTLNGNLPLYLIDGVPFTSSSLNSAAISTVVAGGNPLSAINPNDIESIEILKDADATAIYGSRGANGVVLITTKRAKAGKPKLDLNVYQGVGRVAHHMDSVGNLNWENGTWTNPLAVLRRKYFNTTDNFIGNSLISYEIIKNLRIKSNFGFTSMTTEEIGINPISSFDPQYAALLEGYSNFGDGKIQTWIAEPMMDYNISFGKGVLTALIGSTFQESTQTNRSIEAYGYTNDGLLENLGAASTIVVASNDASVYKYTAGFARLNLNWNEKYIINLTGRRDGSSRFGPGNQFANFGAVGAAWIFSNESFLKENSILSFGKLRASYGTTGSDAIGNYQYMEAFSTTRYPYGGAGGLALSRLANPNYSWETNTKAEVGLDLKFLADRITLSASYFNNRSKAQLVGLPLPIMTGQSSVQFDLPAKVQNTGIELLLSASIIKKNKLEWTSSLNVTFPSNKLIEFPNLDEFPAYIAKYDVGKSVYTYKGFQYNGINPQTGLSEIVDRNNDGELSGPADFVGLKRNTQTLFGGIANKLRYANFQLDFFFQFVKQNGFSYRQNLPYPGSISNQPNVVMDRWKEEGDASANQRFAATDPLGEVGLAYYYQQASDRNIVDAFFIRLKNLSLSWQIPSGWTSKTPIKEARLFVQGQNLWTITSYVGLDPETQSTVTLPPLRTVSVGFNLSL